MSFYDMKKIAILSRASDALSDRLSSAEEKIDQQGIEIESLKEILRRVLDGYDGGERDE